MTLEIERIQALCFDVDGTLSDTDDQMVSVIAGFLRPIRFLLRDHNETRAARRFVMRSEGPGNALIGIPDRFGFDDELTALAEWVTRNRPLPRSHFLLVPGIKEMLAALKPHYSLSVVSARDDKSTRRFLDQFALTPFFDVIVTSLTAEHTKPYPDPIFYAAKAMNVDPRNCLMIGDTTIDIRAGQAAGAQTVGVLCGFGEEDELRRRGADVILQSTAELAGMLLK
jgi:phosphoglycolate phosphatase-like HAD superfamily hydrolase